MNAVSACTWVFRKFWREWASSRSTIRKSNSLGRIIAAPGPPECPQQRLQAPPAGCCRVAVVPGSSDHCGSQPVGRWSACSRPSWPAPPLHPQNTCCSSHCGHAQGEWLRMGTGLRPEGSPGSEGPSVPPDSPAYVHLQGRQGAGCHDPGRHTKHHGVGEDGRLGEILQGRRGGAGRWPQNPDAWASQGPTDPDQSLYPLVSREEPVGWLRSLGSLSPVVPVSPRNAALSSPSLPGHPLPHWSRPTG